MGRSTGQTFLSFLQSSNLHSSNSIKHVGRDRSSSRDVRVTERVLSARERDTDRPTRLFSHDDKTVTSPKPAEQAAPAPTPDKGKGKAVEEPSMEEDEEDEEEDDEDEEEEEVDDEEMVSPLQFNSLSQTRRRVVKG